MRDQQVQMVSENINLGTYVCSIDCQPIAHNSWNPLTPWKWIDNPTNTMIGNKHPTNISENTQIM